MVQWLMCEGAAMVQWLMCEGAAMVQWLMCEGAALAQWLMCQSMSNQHIFPLTLSDYFEIWRSWRHCLETNMHQILII